MPLPREYADFIDVLEAGVAKARDLKLWRTSERLQGALREARGEAPEIANDATVAFRFGPVREQTRIP